MKPEDLSIETILFKLGYRNGDKYETETFLKNKNNISEFLSKAYNKCQVDATSNSSVAMDEIYDHIFIRGSGCQCCQNHLKIQIEHQKLLEEVNEP